MHEFLLYYLEEFFIAHATFSEENNRSFFRDLSIYIKITHKFDNVKLSMFEFSFVTKFGFIMMDE